MKLQGGLLTIPIGIDGHWARFVIDSGAERTTVSDEFAHRFNLSSDTRYVTRATGIGGSTKTADVAITRLVIGGIQFPINRIATGLFSLRSPQGLQADGLLGADILLAFDLDIDIPARKLTFYRSQSCRPDESLLKGPVVAVEGIGVSKDRLIVPFRLDGIVGRGVFDTGSEKSVVGASLAHQIGLTAAILSQDPQSKMQGVGGASTARAHLFRELEVGRETIHGAEILVLPSDLGTADALLGADFLRNRRTWLSFRSRQLIFADQSEGPGRLQ